MTRRIPFLRLVLPLGLALACGTAALAAAPRRAPAAGGLATPDYRIETDETHWNFNSGDFTMPHRVRFYRPGTDAVGDKATGNSKHGTATLIGSVVVHDSGNATEGRRRGVQRQRPGDADVRQARRSTRRRSSTRRRATCISRRARAPAPPTAPCSNRASGMLHLEGGVHLTDNGSTLSANSVDYNLNTKDAEVHGGPAVMTQPANKRPPAAPTPALGAARPTSAGLAVAATTPRRAKPSPTPRNAVAGAERTP